MTIEQLRHAAQLAAIALAEDEQPMLLEALQLLEPVASLLTEAADADAYAVSPVRSAAFPDALRPDASITPATSRESLLCNAPVSQNGCFIVGRQLPREEECP